MEYVGKVVEEVKSVVDFHDYLLKEFIVQNMEEIVKAGSADKAVKLLDTSTMRERCRSIVLPGLKEMKSKIDDSTPKGSYEHVVAISEAVVEIGHHFWCMKTDLRTTFDAFLDGFNSKEVN